VLNLRVTNLGTSSVYQCVSVTHFASWWISPRTQVLGTCTFASFHRFLCGIITKPRNSWKLKQICVASSFVALLCFPHCLMSVINLKGLVSHEKVCVWCAWTAVQRSGWQ